MDCSVTQDTLLFTFNPQSYSLQYKNATAIEAFNIISRCQVVSACVGLDGEIFFIRRRNKFRLIIVSVGLIMIIIQCRIGLSI